MKNETKKFKTSKHENYHTLSLLIEQISVLQKKIKQLNEDNFELQKVNQDLKFKQTESEIVNKHMETFISSLENEYEETKKFYEQKLSEDSIRKEDIENKINDTQVQIDQLLNERDA
jgi:prefoldin subunit 5